MRTIDNYLAFELPNLATIFEDSEECKFLIGTFDRYDPITQNELFNQCKKTFIFENYLKAAFYKCGIGILNDLFAKKPYISKEDFNNILSKFRCAKLKVTFDFAESPEQLGYPEENSCAKE